MWTFKILDDKSWARFSPISTGHHKYLDSIPSHIFHQNTNTRLLVRDETEMCKMDAVRDIAADTPISRVVNQTSLYQQFNWNQLSGLHIIQFIRILPLPPMFFTVAGKNAYMIEQNDCRIGIST